jgi:hypothetical protein
MTSSRIGYAHRRRAVRLVHLPVRLVAWHRTVRLQSTLAVQAERHCRCCRRLLTERTVCSLVSVVTVDPSFLRGLRLQQRLCKPLMVLREPASRPASTMRKRSALRRYSTAGTSLSVSNICRCGVSRARCE